MQQLQELVSDLADYIDYRLMEGERTDEIAPEVVRALAGAPSPSPPPLRSAPPEPRAAPPRPATTALPAPPPPAMAATPGTSPLPAALPPGSDDTASALAAIAHQVAGCTRCPLHSTRRHAVPGQGTPHPEILFVGEAPGAEEDAQGLAFVGAAGQLLTRMIVAMGLSREQVFIGNILKCRPPGNRTPTQEEMALCLPFLKAQIAQLQPQIIVALGATACKGLLHTPRGITSLRGTWQSFEGIPLMPTYHPAYLLRYPAAKRQAWQDLKTVLARLGRTPPPVPPAS